MVTRLLHSLRTYGRNESDHRAVLGIARRMAQRRVEGRRHIIPLAVVPDNRALMILSMLDHHC